MAGMSRKRYPTDLTDLQRFNIEHLTPGPRRGGRPAKYARRDIVAAIFYLLRSGCSWRMLPHDFPPWDTVYGYFRRWQRDGTWRRGHHAPRGDRPAPGRPRPGPAARGGGHPEGENPAPPRPP